MLGSQSFNIFDLISFGNRAQNCILEAIGAKEAVNLGAIEARSGKEYLS